MDNTYEDDNDNKHNYETDNEDGFEVQHENITAYAMVQNILSSEQIYDYLEK